MDGKGRPTVPLSRSQSVRMEKSDKYGVEWVDDKEVKSCTGCGKTTTACGVGLRVAREGRCSAG